MRFQDLRTDSSRPLRLRLVASPRLAAACLAAALLTAALTVAYPAAFGHYTQQPDPPLHNSGGVPPANPAANPRPDANQILEYSMQRQQNLKRIEELNVLRQKEMKEDTTKLLQLANEVKFETRPTRDSISAVELHKVEAIEKLAHSVREKMTYTVGN
jgi:hypothetical protein